MSRNTGFTAAEDAVTAKELDRIEAELDRELGPVWQKAYRIGFREGYEKGRLAGLKERTK